MTAGEFSPDDKISEFIADLRYPLDNILDKAKSIKKGDAIIQSIINDLQAVKIIFNELSSSEQEITVRDNRKGTLSIHGGVRLNMNEPVFNKLMQKIPDFRNNIISN